MNNKIFVALVQFEDEPEEKAFSSYQDATDHLVSIARRTNFSPDVVDSMRIKRFAIDKTFVPFIYQNLTFEEESTTPEDKNNESAD